MNYIVPAECDTCSQEKDVEVELPEDYSDSDVREALEDSPLPCSNCRDQAWVRGVGDLIPVQAGS